MNNSSRIFRLGLLLILAAAPYTPLPAQDTAPTTLPDLIQHKNLWPAQLTLKAPVSLDIISNGRKIGSTVAVEGSTVDLVDVTPTAIEIKVVSATATVSPDQTDLWAQVAALAKQSSAVAATPTPAPAAATPSPSTSSTTNDAMPALRPRSLPPPTPDATNTTSAPSAARPLPPPPPVNPAAPTSKTITQLTLTPTEAPVTGDPLTFDYDGKPSDTFTKASFHFWSPSYKDPIRGVIALIAGGDRDSGDLMADDSWQALAQKYRLAIVYATFTSQSDTYTDASHGSGAALFDALAQFATMSKRPEVETAPLVLYGENSGGEFGYDLVSWKPERVICFVVNKGADVNGASATQDSRAVPGIFIMGQNDDKKINDAVTKLWQDGRDTGAPWALAMQPGSGHDTGGSPRLTRAFFEPVIQARLPSGKNSSPSDPLKPMPDGVSWIGDLKTNAIHDGSTSSDKDADLKGVWLPTQDAAQAWKDFVAP